MDARNRRNLRFTARQAPISRPPSSYGDRGTFQMHTKIEKLNDNTIQKQRRKRPKWNDRFHISSNDSSDNNFDFFGAMASNQSHAPKTKLSSKNPNIPNAPLDRSSSSMLKSLKLKSKPPNRPLKNPRKPLHRSGNIPYYGYNVTVPPIDPITGRKQWGVKPSGHQSRKIRRKWTESPHMHLHDATSARGTTKTTNAHHIGSNNPNGTKKCNNEPEVNILNLENMAPSENSSIYSSDYEDAIEKQSVVSQARTVAIKKSEIMRNNLHHKKLNTLRVHQVPSVRSLSAIRLGTNHSIAKNVENKENIGVHVNATAKTQSVDKADQKKQFAKIFANFFRSILAEKNQMISPIKGKNDAQAVKSDDFDASPQVKSPSILSKSDVIQNGSPTRPSVEQKDEQSDKIATNGVTAEDQEESDHYSDSFVSDDEDDTYDKKKGRIAVDMTPEEAEAILNRSRNRISADKHAQFLAPLDDVTSMILNDVITDVNKELDDFCCEIADLLIESETTI